jgi:hypothetical protein
MKIAKRIVSLFIAVSLVTSCALIEEKTNGLNKLDPENVIEVSDITENYSYFTVFADAEFDHTNAFGLHIKYGSMRFRSLDVMSNYNIAGGIAFTNNITGRDINFDNFDGSNLLTYRATYSYPIFSKLRKKRFPTPIQQTTNNNSSQKFTQESTGKLLYSDRYLVDNLSVSLGFESVFTGFRSDDRLAYGFPEFNNDPMDYFASDYFAIYSNTQFLTAGMKLSRLVNSVINVKLDGEEYNGHFLSILDLGLNVLVVLQPKLIPLNLMKVL